MIEHTLSMDETLGSTYGTENKYKNKQKTENNKYW
jgi:hypothetical protein